MKTVDKNRYLDQFMDQMDWFYKREEIYRTMYYYDQDVAFQKAHHDYCTMFGQSLDETFLNMENLCNY